MRVSLENAPWWVYSLICGVPFGVGTGFVGSGFDWGGALISGTLFGAIVGSFIAWQARRERAVLGAAVSTEQLRRARRASQRGPVPTDPETRQQAYQLAVRTLERITRGRVFALLACAMVGFAAITTSAWYWLAVALCAGMFGYSFWWPRRLSRRIEDLRAGGDGTGRTGPPNITPH